MAYCDVMGGFDIGSLHVGQDMTLVMCPINGCTGVKRQKVNLNVTRHLLPYAALVLWIEVFLEPCGAT